MICCRKCKGLFVGSEEMGNHGTECTGNPFKSPCLYFACERKLYFQLFESEDFQEVVEIDLPTVLTKAVGFLSQEEDAKLQAEIESATEFLHHQEHTQHEGSEFSKNDEYILESDTQDQPAISKTIDFHTEVDVSKDEPMVSKKNLDLHEIMNENINYLKDEKASEFLPSTNEPRLQSPFDRQLSRHLSFIDDTTLLKSRMHSPFEKSSGFLQYGNEPGFHNPLTFSSNPSVPFSCNLATDLLSSYASTQEETQQALLSNIEECPTLQYLDLAKKDPFLGQNPSFQPQVNSKDPFLINATVKQLPDQKCPSQLIKSSEDLQEQTSPTFHLQDSNYFNFASTLDEPTQLDYLDLATLDLLTNPCLPGYGTGYSKDKQLLDRDEAFSEDGLISHEPLSLPMDHIFGKALTGSSNALFFSNDDQLNPFTQGKSTKHRMAKEKKPIKEKIKAVRKSRNTTPKKNKVKSDSKETIPTTIEKRTRKDSDKVAIDIANQNNSKVVAEKVKQIYKSPDKVVKNEKKETARKQVPRLRTPDTKFNVKEQLVQYTEEERSTFKAVLNENGMVIVKKQKIHHGRTGLSDTSLDNTSDRLLCDIPVSSSDDVNCEQHRGVKISSSPSVDTCLSENVTCLESQHVMDHSSKDVQISTPKGLKTMSTLGVTVHSCEDVKTSSSQSIETPSEGVGIVSSPGVNYIQSAKTDSSQCVTPFQRVKIDLQQGVNSFQCVKIHSAQGANALQSVKLVSDQGVNSFQGVRIDSSQGVNIKKSENMKKYSLQGEKRKSFQCIKMDASHFRTPEPSEDHKRDTYQDDKTDVSQHGPKHASAQIIDVDAAHCAKSIQSDNTRSPHEVPEKMKVEATKTISLISSRNNCSVKCPQCDFVCTSVSVLKAHFGTHTKSFLCPLCGDIFSDKQGLKNHETKKHTGDYAYRCTKCDYKTTRKQALKDHMVKHDDQPMHLHVQFRSPKHKPQFAITASVKAAIPNVAAMNRATGNYQYCDVDGCEFKTVYKRVLTKHKDTHIGGRRLYCDQCTVSVADLAALRRHLHQVHKSTDKYFQCSECKYCAASREDVVKHYKVRHLQLKNYHCNQCDFKTGYTNKLRLHIMSHAGILPYKCSACTYQVNDSFRVERHIRTVHVGKAGVTVVKMDLPFELESKQFKCQDNDINSADIKVIEITKAEMEELKSQGEPKNHTHRKNKSLKANVNNTHGVCNVIQVSETSRQPIVLPMDAGRNTNKKINNNPITVPVLNYETCGISNLVDDTNMTDTSISDENLLDKADTDTGNCGVDDDTNACVSDNLGKLSLTNDRTCTGFMESDTMLPADLIEHVKIQGPSNTLKDSVTAYMCKQCSFIFTSTIDIMNHLLDCNVKS